MVPSLANRYRRSLLSGPPGPRPRAGYSFWQRYWASLTGMTPNLHRAQAVPARRRSRSSLLGVFLYMTTAVSVSIVTFMAGVAVNQIINMTPLIGSGVSIGAASGPEAEGTISLPRESGSLINGLAHPSLKSSTVMTVNNGAIVMILCAAKGELVANPNTGQSSRWWYFVYGIDSIRPGFIPSVFFVKVKDLLAVGNCASTLYG